MTEGNYQKPEDCEAQHSGHQYDTIAASEDPSQPILVITAEACDDEGAPSEHHDCVEQKLVEVLDLLQILVFV